MAPSKCDVTVHVNAGDSVEKSARPSFCAVALPHLVYAGPRTRKEFDCLPIEETVFAWKPDSAETLIRNDGQQYECRCHSKTFESHSRLTVIFQWVEYHTVRAAEGGAA